MISNVHVCGSMAETFHFHIASLFPVPTPSWEWGLGTRLGVMQRLFSSLYLPQYTLAHVLPYAHESLGTRVCPPTCLHLFFPSSESWLTSSSSHLHRSLKRRRCCTSTATLATSDTGYTTHRPSTDTAASTSSCWNTGATARARGHPARWVRPPLV